MDNFCVCRRVINLNISALRWFCSHWEPLDGFCLLRLYLGKKKNNPQHSPLKETKREKKRGKKKSHWPRLNIFSFFSSVVKLKNQLCSQLYLAILSPGDIPGAGWGGRGNFATCRGAFCFQISLPAASHWSSWDKQITKKKLIYLYFKTGSFSHLRIVIRLLAGGYQH